MHICMCIRPRACAPARPPRLSRASATRRDRAEVSEPGQGTSYRGGLGWAVVEISVVVSLSVPLSFALSLSLSPSLPVGVCVCVCVCDVYVCTYAAAVSMYESNACTNQCERKSMIMYYCMIMYDIV